MESQRSRFEPVRRTPPESPLRELEPLSRDSTGAARGVGAGALVGATVRDGIAGRVGAVCTGAGRVCAACTGAERVGARFTGIGLLRTAGADAPVEYPREPGTGVLLRTGAA